MISWVVVSISFIFTPVWGKIPILTNNFERGWNHQLVAKPWWSSGKWNETISSWFQTPLTSMSSREYTSDQSQFVHICSFLGFSVVPSSSSLSIVSAVSFTQHATCQPATLEPKLPLVSCRGWSSTQFRRGLYTHDKDSRHSRWDEFIPNVKSWSTRAHITYPCWNQQLAPENRPSQKEISSSNHSFLGASY